METITLLRAEVSDDLSDLLDLTDLECLNDEQLAKVGGGAGSCLLS